MSKPYRIGAWDESRPGTPIESLLRELGADAGTTETDGSPSLPSHEAESGPELAVATVMNTLFPDTDFHFDEGQVKDSLDELLLTLIGLRSRDTHGKGLMGDLTMLFDSRLSPGTVYPRLHELEDEGVVRGHEMVRTKEYRIDDVEATKSRIQETMYQHLALGLYFHAALESL